MHTGQVLLMARLLLPCQTPQCWYAIVMRHEAPSMTPICASKVKEEFPYDLVVLGDVELVKDDHIVSPALVVPLLAEHALPRGITVPRGRKLLFRVAEVW